MARVKFRYQKPYSKTYRVGEVIGTQPECQFSSIQDAIDQAVADGHTLANRALIEIYPKDGGYNEDLVLASGVDLIGMDAINVGINGNISYAPTTGNRNTNRVRLKNLGINSAAGADTVTVGGAQAVARWVSCPFKNSGANLFFNSLSITALASSSFLSALFLVWKPTPVPNSFS